MTVVRLTPRETLRLGQLAAAANGAAQAARAAESVADAHRGRLVEALAAVLEAHKTPVPPGARTHLDVDAATVTVGTGV